MNPNLNESVLSLILGAGLVVKIVLAVLVMFSVISWGIILAKFFTLRAAKNQSESFLDFFWENKKLELIYQKSAGYKSSPIAKIFKAAYQDILNLKKTATSVDSAVKRDEVSGMMAELGGIEMLSRTLRQASTVEVTRLESYLTFLATTGSTAPFIGLFGTVWGIMNSFHGIALKGSANLAVVAPGISEALIATAIGLVVAIPAVIAYNYYLNKIRVFTAEMDNFSMELLNIAEKISK